jgi:hypothetical protein
VRHGHTRRGNLHLLSEEKRRWLGCPERERRREDEDGLQCRMDWI